MQNLSVIPTVSSKQLDKLVASLNPTTLSTLRRIFDNIFYYPNDDKYRQIKLANKTFSSKVWQYPAGEELMKMNGWIVEGNHVRLTDDSHVHIMVKLLNQFCALPSDQHRTIMKALFNGDTAAIEKMLNLSNVSIAGIVNFQDESSINLLKVAFGFQDMDLISLLVKTYSVDIYIPSQHTFNTMFELAPECFAIEVLTICGIKTSFTLDGFTLLHLAVMYNCPKIVHHLITKGADVNAASRFVSTPLHYANIFNHKEIADYLSQNGADATARDYKGRTPLDYIGGNPKMIEISQHIQDKRRIHMKPYSAEREYYLKLVNSGVDEESAVSYTIEQFPSLKQKEVAHTQDCSNHAAIREELAKYIDIRSRSTSYTWSSLSVNS